MSKMSYSTDGFEMFYGHDHIQANLLIFKFSRLLELHLNISHCVNKQVLVERNSIRGVALKSFSALRKSYFTIPLLTNYN